MSNPHIGSGLEDFLAEEGRLEEATQVAAKRILIWQLEEALEEAALAKSALAARMGTSRTQVDRLLDPANDRVTLHSRIEPPPVSVGGSGSRSNSSSTFQPVRPHPPSAAVAASNTCGA
jgi:antitoxin HicB